MIQYEFRTRKLAQRRPTRSSAVDLRERWYLSWLIPWLVGFPARENFVSTIFHILFNTPDEDKGGVSSVLSLLLPHALALSDEHTVGSSLWCWALASTAANTNTVDDIALLGLVAETACLVWARWARCAVNNVQLAELYYALSAKFNECIAET